jgi:outer membrane immunogenic protein
MDVCTAGKQMTRSTMKRILATVLFSAVAAGSAFAADLPPAAPPRAPALYVPAVLPVYNWTGFYIGINGGWAFGQSDWTVPGATTGNFNVNGGLVGGTIGANWQSDWFVAGIEGDFDGQWLDGKVSNTCSPVNCETKSTWLATIRGRLGYAADRVLFYATGGGAFANIEANTSNTFQSKSKGGWTAGAGIEGAFTDHWTARVEYLFVGLQNATGFTTLPGATTVKLNENLIRVGVDYKF